MRLKDQVALITGGGQGIGRAYALRFAREGAKVVIAEINEDNGRKVADEVKALGAEALYLKVDVSNEASCAEMAAKSHERFGRIDVLLNNAAIFYGLDREDQSLAYFNRILSVNLTGGVYVNQSAAFSDFHGTGANPAANAALTDAAYVANRFRVVQHRRHV